MELCKVVLILLVSTVLFLCSSVSKAMECEVNDQNPYRVAYSIVVDKSGNGNFTTIQAAIDSIPPRNSQWIRIQISPGVYGEKVRISSRKTCIFLDGAGPSETAIEWNDHSTTFTSATFSTFADNLAVRGITFRNTYNAPGSVKEKRDVAPAVAALIYGDKTAFYNCSFVGLQDTLWDGSGRHYYLHSYIEGVIDIISGSGQSIYQRCQVNVSVESYAPVLENGFITAQGRESESGTNGFVFKNCSITGTGKALLGRAYRPYSRVFYYASYLSAVVDPLGWDAWHQIGHEWALTFAEEENYGEGAETSKRVGWLKKLSPDEVKHFTSLSYIDQEGWISKLPLIYN